MEALQLKLAGNCYPDLAGWKFRIVRTDPIPDWVDVPDYDGIATDQSGTIGDVTADQVHHHYECSVEEFVRRLHDGDPPPSTLRKALYLEWFSNRNGRVVIQDTRLAVERIGERAFELTEQQWADQAKQNQEEISFFMYQIGDALSNTSEFDGDVSDSDD